SHLPNVTTCATSLIGKMNEYYRVNNNISWVSILSQTFNLVFLLAGSLVCICSSNGFHSFSFYKTCKFNIKANRFTAGDYICAQIINSLLQKTLVLWSLSMIIYWALYFTVNTNIIESATASIGHFLPIALLLYASFLIGVYSLLMEFAPIPIRWFTFITVLYVLFGQILPISLISSILLNKLGLSELCDPFSYLISLFFSNRQYTDRDYILACFEISPSNNYYINILIDSSIALYKNTMRYSPCFFFSHMLAKISYYLKNLKVNKEITKHGLTYDENALKYQIVIETWNIPIDAVSPDISQNLLKYNSDICHEPCGVYTYNSQLDQTMICEDFHPLEIFNKAHSLDDMSFLHIVWSGFCFWVVPTTLMLLCILYTYKKLLPTVRN
ncbi:hypothetical protein NEIRO02_2338, partial [Nematocida sp. AWRm79]